MGTFVILVYAGIAKSTLREFWFKHAVCEQALKSWYNEADKSERLSPADIKAGYPGASILANDRIVFNIKGNSYRLIVKINYAYQLVWIRFVGTHAAYDKIKATKYKTINIKPIKNEQDYQDALQRPEVICDAKPNSKEDDELEILGVLIDNFEKNYSPIDLPDPIGAIKFRMEQLNYTNNDLARIIGLKSRVSEILSKNANFQLI